MSLLPTASIVPILVAFNLVVVSMEAITGDDGIRRERDEKAFGNITGERV